MPVTPFMDRTVTPLAKMQLDFIRYAGRAPFVQMAEFLPGLADRLLEVDRNTAKWEQIRSAEMDAAAAAGSLPSSSTSSSSSSATA